MEEDNPGECSAGRCAEDFHDWRWNIPGTESHYCIECIAQELSRFVYNGSEPWPPHIEDVPIPVDQFADRLLALDGEYHELLPAYHEADQYRHIANPAHRIFCPRNTRAGTVDGDEQVSRCNTFIRERQAFVEGERHNWVRCPRCHELVCIMCGRARTYGNGGNVEGICTRTPEMLAEQEVYEAGEEDGRGIAFQNEILCNCGTSYCYLCGSEIEQHGGDHFTDPRGCPRYYRRGDPRVRWDEVVSATDTPSDDDQLENELRAGIDESADHDAHHVESLNPSASDQWRLAANHLEEAYRMGRIEGNGIERGYGPWYNLWMEILIRGARHMLAMLSNGIGSEAPAQEQRMENVHRRMRFTHNGLLVRFALSRIRRHLGADFELPGGNDAYALLEPFSRRLRFQPGAVPNSYDERQQEWVTLRKVIQDQLHVQHPEQHLLGTAWEELQNYRTIWARALLQPVSDLLLILERNWKRDNFTLADSADLRNGRNLLQERLRTLSNEVQINAMFRNLGDEPRTICEIAELFANRLLEDDGSTSTINWETQDINRRAEYCFSRTWSYEIMDTMEIETANLNQARPEAIPGRFGELYPNIVAMNNAAENFLAQPDIPDGILDHHLANFRRILNIYTRRIGEPDAQGNLNTDILAGDGPLGSIFFYMLHVMERIINQNVDRHVSQRSSISSNANNAVREDRALIDNEYIAALSARAELDGPLSPVTNFTLQLLAPLRRLLVRMDEPGRWDNATNQQDFDQLREWLWRYDAGTLEEPGWPTRAGNRRLMRVWARRYPGAVDDPAINPARTARERDREELCDELNEVAVLTAHLSDSTYVRGFEQRIHQTRRDLWQDFTNDPPQIFTDLISFLQRLRTASDYHALPLELQSGQARLQMEHYNTRQRQFDVRNSAVGDLRDFPRLWDIWNRVTNYGTSPAPARSSHHSDPA